MSGRRLYYTVGNDVNVFLSKTGITDTVIINAPHNCFDSLVDSGLWSKIKVFYPLVGGTAYTTKFDLVRRNKSAFDIIWHGSPIFSYNGVMGGAGLNAYGDTSFNILNNTTVGDEGYTLCIGTNDASFSSDEIIFGGFNGLAKTYSLLVATSTSFGTRLNSAINSISNSTKLGIYSINRNSSNLSMLKNTTVVKNVTTSGDLPNVRIYLLNVMNSLGPYSVGYSAGRLQTTVIHFGLTDAESINLQNIINTFENDLGRKTW